MTDTTAEVKDSETTKVVICKEKDCTKDPFYILFSPLHKCVLGFGLVFPDWKTGNTIFEKIYHLLCCIALCAKCTLSSIFIVCLFIRQFNSGFQLNTLQAWRLADTMWATESLISIFYLIYWKKHTYVEALSMSIDKATNQKGIKKFYSKLALLLKICLCLCPVFVATVFLSCLNLYYSLFESFGNVPMTAFFGKPSLNFLALVVTFYLAGGWYFTTLVYGLLCKCLLVEFSTINNDLKTEIDINKETLEKHLNMFSKMRFVVETANKTFSNYIMIMLFTNIVNVVILLYAILTNPFFGIGNIFVIIWLSGAFIQLWALSWLPAEVNEEAGKFGETIFQKLNEENIEPTSELYIIASLSVLRNVNSPVGIQVGRFFYITKGLVLTVGSVIMTYLTLTIQSYPELLQQNICTVNESIHTNSKT